MAGSSDRPTPVIESDSVALQSNSDESLRLLVESVPGVLYSYDLIPGRPRRCNYLSPGFAELLGPRACREIEDDFNRLFDRIHPEDWPRLRKLATQASSAGTPLNSEARLRRDDGQYRWVRSFGRPSNLPDNGTRWHVVLVDIQEQKDLEAEHRRVEERLRESEQQLRLITDSLPVLIGYVDRTETYRFANAAYLKWWDKSSEEVCGCSMRELLGADNYNLVKRHADCALAGESVVYEGPIVDAFGNHREAHVLYVPRHTDSGDVHGFYVVVTDLTATRQDAQRRRLMMRELDHRVKNNLAAVLSLAHQTLEHSSTLEEFAPAFFGRIHAMSKAHEVLAEAQWSGLDLERGARLVLGPYMHGVESRISLCGPSIALPSSSALPLCMTIHELGTNAAKHGSLSSTSGTVSVNWTIESNVLSLRWIERGGPPVSDDCARGTGMELIRGFIEFELRGSMIANFEPNGLECSIRVPLRPRRNEDTDTDGIATGQTIGASE